MLLRVHVMQLVRDFSALSSPFCISCRFEVHPILLQFSTVVISLFCCSWLRVKGQTDEIKILRFFLENEVIQSGKISHVIYMKNIKEREADEKNRQKLTLER